jgi:hypothetical protein
MLNRAIFGTLVRNWGRFNKWIGRGRHAVPNGNVTRVAE